MQFDGGLSRDEAEREAWALVSKRYRLSSRPCHRQQTSPG
jgi:hypothetical protein